MRKIYTHGIKNLFRFFTYVYVHVCYVLCLYAYFSFSTYEARHYKMGKMSGFIKIEIDAYYYMFPFDNSYLYIFIYIDIGLLTPYVLCRSYEAGVSVDKPFSCWIM